MDPKFLKDCVVAIIVVAIGGLLFGTLAHVFRIDPPTYVTNVTQPCIIPPVTIPTEPR